MEQSKYKELKAENEALRALAETTNEKVMTQHRMMQAMNTLLQNFDSRFDIMKEHAEKHGWFTAETFEDAMDIKAGMFRKNDGDTVEIGDVVWVDYTAKNPASEITEKDFPLRVGSKTVVFEDSIAGKKIGETFDCTHDVDKSPVDFTITIVKAKQKLNLGAQDGATTIPAAGTQPENTTPANH